MEGDFMKPVISIVDELLEAGVNVTVYNGQLDLIVDTMGRDPLSEARGGGVVWLSWKGTGLKCVRLGAGDVEMLGYNVCWYIHPPLTLTLGNSGSACSCDPSEAHAAFEALKYN